MRGKALRGLIAQRVSVSAHKSGPVFRRGFSTLELMVTVSMTAILAGLAIPYYQVAIEKQQITNEAEQIVTFIRTIQGESIKRNRKVTVSYTVQESGNWCIVAIEGNTPCECTQTDTAAADFCSVDSGAWVLRDSEVQSRNLISLISGDGAYAYDPVRGILADPTDRMTLALQSGQGQFEMNLSVIGTGMVSLCQPLNGQQIHGFDTCPSQF